MTRRQQGFTLVEIAIVLVIIGLLLGGILKGQELINSARVRNIADTNSGIQAAYFGFIDRYRAVPGDMCRNKAETALGLTVVSGGNGDGSLNNKTAGAGDCDSASGNTEFAEASALWEHLWKAGFIQGSYEGNAADESDYMSKAPVNPFNGSLLLFRTADYTEWDSAGKKSTKPTSIRLNVTLGHYVPVNIARELDVKVDDSRPFTGVLRLSVDGANAVTGNPDFKGLTIQTSGATPCFVTGSNEYDIANNGDDCNLAYLY